MDWVQVTVLTTTEGSEVVSDMLIEAGSHGTMIEDRADLRANQRPAGQWDMIDDALAARMGEDVRVTGYYPADDEWEARIAGIRLRTEELRGMRTAFPLGKLEIESVRVDEEDWAEYWKREFQPFRLGRHMLVAPSWTNPQPEAGDVVIRIDPGMAFGTGTHETTALCAELVEEYVKPGDRVTDVGTGTGILAIAAAHQGARSLLAIDIDSVAVRVAEENVRANGLADRIRCRRGDLLQAVDEMCDVLIANIIAEVISAIARPARALIVDGGLFICSGIIRDKRDEVVGALKMAGYHDLDIREQGEWVAVAARK